MKDSAEEPPSMLGDDPYTPGTPRADRGLGGSLPASPKVLSPSPKKGRPMQQFEHLTYPDVKSNGQPKIEGGGPEDEMDDGLSHVQLGRRSDIGELPVVRPTPPPVWIRHNLLRSGNQAPMTHPAHVMNRSILDHLSATWAHFLQTHICGRQATIPLLP